MGGEPGGGDGDADGGGATQAVVETGGVQRSTVTKRAADAVLKSTENWRSVNIMLAANAKSVEIIWKMTDVKNKDREVHVGGVAAFRQEIDTIKNSFLSPFDLLIG